MSETKTHIYTPRLPGFESLDATFDADLEARYPGLKDIFDNFLLLNKAPGDIHDEIYYDRNEFPFQAGIAVPDSATGRLELVSKSGNHTRSEEGCACQGGATVGTSAKVACSFC